MTTIVPECGKGLNIILLRWMDEGLIKDANYFATSVVSAFTALATWRMLRFSYQIYEKKKGIKSL